jgi:hypothetical protein
MCSAAGLKAQYKEKLSQMKASNDAAVTALQNGLAKLEASHGALMAARDVTIASHAAFVAELKASHAAAVAVKDAAATDLKTALATRERECAALQAQAAAQLAAIYAAVTSNLALELHPVRRDRRQFATLHVGPVPFDEFDSVWSVAACDDEWKVDIDPVTHMRACVTRIDGDVTLRAAAPLPRRVPSTGASQQQLPSYRVVIEAYPAPVDGKDTQWCNVGFVPSHTCTDGAPVTPFVGHNKPGGCKLDAGAPAHGWTPLPPRLVIAGDAAGADTSAYATTDKAPPVHPEQRHRIAVDYAANTCRVAFYTPASVAGGLVEAPYAKMELRFVATAAERVEGWGPVPARSVPSAAVDSRVQLYPAVTIGYAGATWRFV